MTLKELFYGLLIVLSLAMQSQASQPSSCSITEIISPTIVKDLKKGPAQNIQIRLKKKFNFLSKEIGWIDCWYYGNLNTIYVAKLNIDHKFQNQMLGKQLLLHALSFLAKIYPTSLIYWKALPLAQEKPTPEDLQRLVKFYSSAGAIDTRKRVNSIETEMYYPMRAASMLAVLRPIFQPRITTKDEKNIILANGARYQTNPHDALGIIANYMGETNHIDQ